MPNVTFLRLNNPKAFHSSAFYDTNSLDDIEAPSGPVVTADRKRKWKLYNDNTLRAKRNIPRKWSSNIYTSGIMTVRDKGSETISPEFKT